MTGPWRSGHTAPTRHAAVAGSFYPADGPVLRTLAERLLRDADLEAAPGRSLPGPVPHAVPHTLALGILVPHAGLEWSGQVAAAGWRLLAQPALDGASVVILGTNHSAWLEGIGVWPGGPWQTPLGEVAVDGALGTAIAALGPPFGISADAHLREHSIEVQLPLLQVVAPVARIVPLAVSTGTGAAAVAAGVRLGQLLAGLAGDDRPIVLAISTDLAHYPAHRACAAATDSLLPPILELDPAKVADRERGLVESGTPGLVCGMCGIAPTVVGLAALRAAGATQATLLARATSADAGGPENRTVGYLAVAFRPDA
jgi:MEMO1 family protein